MADETTAPIPYAVLERVDEPREAVFGRPLPDSLEALLRYAQGDPAFPPPHWVRLRAPKDAAVGERLMTAWRTLIPLVEAYAGPGDVAAARAAWDELHLDPREPAVQEFAATRLEGGERAAASMLFQAASHGLGARFDALFARGDAPAAAHSRRLTALRDHGGMPWSEAFAKAMGEALPRLVPDQAGWTLRMIAELPDPAARRFLQAIAPTLGESERALAKELLDNPPPPHVHEVEAEAAPAGQPAIDKLELQAQDQRKPEQQVIALGRMAELDWARARRLASAISTDAWRLDEVIGTLLNHASHAVMVEDFVARGLLREAVAPPPGKPSARELLRAGGRVVRFDATSIDGIVDHDELAYVIAEALGDALAGVDFLEELTADEELFLHAWDGDEHVVVELDTHRSVIDPYGLVGLINALLRRRERPERGLFAAEDKAVADLVLGPEKELRALVNAGLLWIRAGFRW